MKKGSWVVRIGGGFIAVVALLAIVGSFLPKPAPALPPASVSSAGSAVKPTKAPVPLPRYTASDLARAYEQNSVAADAKFKGKRFMVSGVVAEISTDFMGDPYVTLKGGVNQFLEPHFGFDKKQLEDIATLRKGQKINIACEGRGDVMKASMNADCALL